MSKNVLFFFFPSKVETTQLEEEELLPLVMTLLHGPEMDM